VPYLGRRKSLNTPQKQKFHSEMQPTTKLNLHRYSTTVSTCFHHKSRQRETEELLRLPKTDWDPASGDCYHLYNERDITKTDTVTDTVCESDHVGLESIFLKPGTRQSALHQDCEKVTSLSCNVSDKPLVFLLWLLTVSQYILSYIHKKFLKWPK